MKQLSAIKPTFIGDRGRDISLSTSLTHVKYSYAGDSTTQNVVSFNSFAPGAIAKAGGVFTGPVTLKTYSSKLITAASSSGVVTINLAFGNFFKLSLTENVVGFDVINVPEQAVMFTLIVEQDAAAPRTINWAFNNATVSWGNVDPSTVVTVERTNLDVFSFKTISSGSLWYASVNGLNYQGIGTDNPIDGTFLYNENLYINIDDVQYPNGTKEVLANGLGGTRDGNLNYPAAYPDPGASTFKYVERALLCPDNCGGSCYNNGGTLYVSDGFGGYAIIEEYAAGEFCSEAVVENFFGNGNSSNDITVGYRSITPNGSGGYNVGDLVYISDTFIGTFTNYTDVEYVDNYWRDVTALPTGTGKGSVDVYQYSPGNFTFDYHYEANNTFISSCDWSLGYSLTGNAIIVAASYLADGAGKIKLEANIAPGSVAYTETIPCDSYGYPCDDSYDGYIISYKYDPTAWSSLWTPGYGFGYFYIESSRAT
jgi:hypothetical protein